MGRKESLSEREKVFPILKGSAQPLKRCRVDVMKNKYWIIIFMMIIVSMAATPFSDVLAADSEESPSLQTEQVLVKGKDRQADGQNDSE